MSAKCENRIRTLLRTTSETLGAVTPTRFLKWASIAFIFGIGVLILTPYPHYVPPDFGFGFLRNKSQYFYRSGYFFGFYAHIFGAPLALFAGGLQVSRTLRERSPGFHRRMGQVYVAAVLLFAAPGGLVMSSKAYGGWSSTICFALLAAVTWCSTFVGWRAARAYEIERHVRWMTRSYVLICSAVFLRLTHFSLQPLNLSNELTYQLSAWISWLVPVMILGLVWRISATPFRGIG